MTHSNYCWHQLGFPASFAIEPVAAFMRTLSTRPRRGPMQQSRPVVFEVSGKGGQLSWLLGLPPEEEGLSLRLLHAELPNVRHEPFSGDRPVLKRAWELRTSSQRRPLRTDVSETLAKTLLGALATTRKGETVVVQVLIGPWLRRRPVQASSSTSVGQRGPVPSWNDWQVTAEQATALRTKQKEPLLGMVLRVGITASPARTRTLRQSTIGALQLLRVPGNGFERRLFAPRWAAIRLTILQSPLIKWPCTLNALELAAACGLPIGNPLIPGLRYSGGRQLPAPHEALVSERVAAERHLRVTGKATYPGQSGLVVQGISDALRHTHIVSPTGSGKSVLLARLALADIAAGPERGVVVIDMKGDTVTDLADRIPPEHLDRVVLMEPDRPAPVGFNALQGVHPDVVVDLVVHVMSELYASSWGPRTADVITNGLTTLVHVGGMTLVELPVLLTNATFRRAVLAKLGRDDLGVGPFWQAFESWSEAERAQIIGPSLNKLRALTNRELTRRVLGQANGFDLHTILTDQKVFLANLSAGRIGSQNAQGLGSLLVGALWSQIQQRATISAERRRPVAIYIDEFQNLLRIPIDLGDAMVQARGLGAALTLAHQDFSQLSPVVAGAVRRNAHSRICFATGADDATVLARLLGGGLTPEDIMGLGQYQTYQALCVGGVTASPASVATLPLPPALGSLETVRRLSSQNYGQPGAEVDAALWARRQAEAKDTPVGKRPRGSRP